MVHDRTVWELKGECYLSSCVYGIAAAVLVPAGQVLMSDELEKVANSMFNGKVSGEVPTHMYAWPQATCVRAWAAKLDCVVLQVSRTSTIGHQHA